MRKTAIALAVLGVFATAANAQLVEKVKNNEKVTSTYVQGVGQAIVVDGSLVEAETSVFGGLS